MLFNLPISFVTSKQLIEPQIIADLELLDAKHVDAKHVDAKHTDADAKHVDAKHTDANAKHTDAKHTDADAKHVDANAKHTDADAKHTDAKHTDANAHTDSLYRHVFRTKTDDKILGNKTLPLWSQYFTTDRTFLKNSQTLLKKHNFVNDSLTLSMETDILKIMADVKLDNFHDRYQHYVDYKWLESFNHNAKFLQALSIYNMTSPVLSLMLPIIFLIIPFFILKFQGIPISLNKYIEIIKGLLKRHQLGQIFNIGSASYEKIVYIIISLIFYVMQIYQNISSCHRFYTNMKTIHTQLITTRTFIEISLRRIDAFKNTCDKYNLDAYEPFLQNLETHHAILKTMHAEFIPITAYNLNISKITQIGYVMKCFYRLHNSVAYREALEYSLGFHGYLDNLNGLKENLARQHVAAAKFTNAKGKGKGNGKGKGKGKEPSFVNAYFPPLVDQNPIKNTYKLDKHGLITGPNAAGKTTTLKTILVNILLAQQTGFGFFEKAVFEPFDLLHCYINIPDTSGRDSLFQAEARRCKDIITAITQNNKLRHFCVFDELYSGTNPYEAIGSAYAFLKYLNNCPNATFMLTTHFIELCNRLDKEPAMQNYHMQIIKQEEYTMDFQYTYKLLKGISKVKGGVKVLRDLAYPPEIINLTESIIKELYV